jgi:hypothetical protein
MSNTTAAGTGDTIWYTSATPYSSQNIMVDDITPYNWSISSIIDEKITPDELKEMLILLLRCIKEKIELDDVDKILNDISVLKAIDVISAFRDLLEKKDEVFFDDIEDDIIEEIELVTVKKLA